MTEFLEDFISHPRALVKAVIAIVTIIGLIFKVAVPKIKEKKDRLKEVKSNSGGMDSLIKGIQLYNQGAQEAGVQLIIKGFELGSFDNNAAVQGCKILVHYYDTLNENYNSLRWGRFAVEHNCFDKEILEYMIGQYENMGETAKTEELKELLKNS